MGWFIQMSCPTDHSINGVLPICKARVSECGGYSLLHLQIFLLCSVPQETGLHGLIHLGFFLHSASFSQWDVQVGDHKVGEKRGWYVLLASFLPHVAILAVTMSLPLQIS